MRDILDLDQYPLDKPGTAGWLALVERCKADLAADGMFNLEGLMRPGAIDRAMDEVGPIMDQVSEKNDEIKRTLAIDLVDGTDQVGIIVGKGCPLLAVMAIGSDRKPQGCLGLRPCPGGFAPCQR